MDFSPDSVERRGQGGLFLLGSGGRRFYYPLLLLIVGLTLLGWIQFPSPAAAGFTPTPTPTQTPTFTPTPTPTHTPISPPPPVATVTSTPTPPPLLPETGGAGGWSFPLFVTGGAILLVAILALSRAHHRRA